MHGASEMRRGRHDQLRRTLGKTGLQIVDRHSESLDKLIALARQQDEQITQLQKRHDAMTEEIKSLREQTLVVRMARTFRERLRWLLTGC